MFSGFYLVTDKICRINYSSVSLSETEKAGFNPEMLEKLKFAGETYDKKEKKKEIIFRGKSYSVKIFFLLEEELLFIFTEPTPDEINKNSEEIRLSLKEFSKMLHDIKSPIAVAQSYIDIILHKYNFSLDEKILKYLERSVLQLANSEKILEEFREALFRKE